MARLASVKWQQKLRADAIRRGLIGGSVFWQVVLIVLWLAKLFAKAAKRGEMPVRFSEALAVGETMTIRHIPGDVEGSRDSA